MTPADPTADAFMRRILSHPEDALPRLVFADWLEESDSSSNLAWARFLRMADELATLAPGDRRRQKLAQDLTRIGTLIRACLTIRAELVVAYPDQIAALLPARNIVLKLDTILPPTNILDLVPESVARESQVLPLVHRTDGTLLLAAAEPRNPALLERLEFILNRPIEVYPTLSAEMTACLARNYGQTETESIDSVTYHWLPDDGLRGGPPGLVGDPAVAYWSSLILDATTYLAREVEWILEDGRITVWHIFPNDRRYHEWHIPPDPVLIPRLIPVLHLFLRNVVTPTTEATTTGELTVAFWRHLRLHTVHLADTSSGAWVRISIPPYPTSPIQALNPAA